MNVFFEILFKLLPFYLIAALGFLLNKKFRISQEFLAKIFFYILMPVVVFYGVLKVPLLSDDILLPLFYFVISVVFSLLYWFIGGYFWKDTTKNLLAFTNGISNVGNLGTPLAIALFGREATGPAVLITIGGIFYINTVGYYIALKGHFSAKDSLYKLLRLPSFYAFFLAILFQLFGINLLQIKGAGIMDRFVDGYNILGLLLLGISIEKIRKEQLDKLYLFLTMTAKFIVYPVCFGLFLFLDSRYFHIFNSVSHQVLLLQSLIPVGVNVVSLAIVTKVHPEKAAAGVLISTLFSLIYIPVMAALFLK